MNRITLPLIDRYVGIHVIWGTLLALAVLVALFTFIELVEELEEVGNADYTLGGAVEYLLLTLPRRAFELFPLAAVTGSLIGLGALAAGSELTVVRSSGVSVARITVSVLAAGTVLLVISVFLGEVLAPICERLAQERRSVALYKRVMVRSVGGLWLRDGSSYINIRQVMPDNQMARVYIYEFDESNRLRVSTYARHARFEQGQWLLEDVVQSVVGEDGVESSRLARGVWKSQFEPRLVSAVSVRPEALSAVGLYRYLGYLRDNGLSTSRYELALWSKLAYPLATLVMILIALPMVLGRLRASGVGQRIVAGTLLGIAFHVVHQSSMQMGLVFDLSPAFAATAPTLLFLAVGLWMLARVR